MDRTVWIESVLDEGRLGVLHEKGGSKVITVESQGNRVSFRIGPLTASALAEELEADRG